MTLTQVLLILRARMWSALVVFLLVVLATLAVSLVLPKKYTATASIVVDVRSPDPILGAILPLIGSGYMTTQIDPDRPPLELNRPRRDSDEHDGDGDRDDRDRDHRDRDRDHGHRRRGADDLALDEGVDNDVPDLS